MSESIVKTFKSGDGVPDLDPVSGEDSGYSNVDFGADVGVYLDNCDITVRPLDTMAPGDSIIRGPVDFIMPRWLEMAQLITSPIES